jgi:hypothetical protein
MNEPIQSPGHPVVVPRRGTLRRCNRGPHPGHSFRCDRRCVSAFTHGRVPEVHLTGDLGAVKDDDSAGLTAVKAEDPVDQPSTCPRSSFRSSPLRRSTHAPLGNAIHKDRSALFRSEGITTSIVGQSAVDCYRKLAHAWRTAHRLPRGRLRGGRAAIEDSTAAIADRWRLDPRRLDPPAQPNQIC